MNPGTCPECGEFIADRALALRSPRELRRRAVRRGILMSIAATMLIGGWYLYSHVDWLAMLSTDTLLKLRTKPEGRIHDALTARWFSGQMSSEEVDRFFRIHIRTIGLDLRSPAPAGAYLDPKLTVQTTETFSPHYEVLEFTVDGCAWFGAGNLYHSNTSVHFSCPPLKPGEHRIDVRGDVELHTQDGQFFCRLPFTATRTIIVEDRPITDYVRPIWNDEIAAVVRRGVYARVTRSPRNRTALLESDFRQLPIPVALKWTAVDRGAELDCGRSPAVPARARWTHGHSHEVFRDHALSDAIALHAVPDIRAAFNAGFTEYFAGELHWTALPVEPDSDNPSGVGHLADVVRPCVPHPAD
jgi:hypothetical protein